MKFFLLQSFLFFTILLQASWCLAGEGSHGDKAAILPSTQAAQATTVREVEGPERSLYEFHKVGAMEITNKHRGGGEGAAGGGSSGNGNGNGNGNDNGQQGTREPTGAESTHRNGKKHNDAPALGYPWMSMLFGFSICTITMYISL